MRGYYKQFMQNLKIVYLNIEERKNFVKYESSYLYSN